MSDNVSAISRSSQMDNNPINLQDSKSVVVEAGELLNDVFTSGSSKTIEIRLKTLIAGSADPSLFRICRLDGNAIVYEEAQRSSTPSSPDDKGDNILAIYLGETANRHPIYAFKDRAAIRKFNEAKSGELAGDPQQKFDYVALTVDDMMTQSYNLRPKRPFPSPVMVIVNYLGMGMMSTATAGLLTLITGLAAGTSAFSLPLFLAMLGFLVVGSLLISLYLWLVPQTAPAAVR